MEKNERMLLWGSLMLAVIFLIALMPFQAHATAKLEWSKLGGAPMIPGGVKNQEDLIKKLGKPAIQNDYIEAFRQAYPEYDAEELFKAFQMSVECSTLTGSSYQPGTIFPDGMFFKPKNGVRYDSRPVEWTGDEVLESLEVKFPYEDEEFWVSVIMRCGNGIPRKTEEEKVAQEETPQPEPETQIITPPPQKKKIIIQNSVEEEIIVINQPVRRTIRYVNASPAQYYDDEEYYEEYYPPIGRYRRGVPYYPPQIFDRGYYYRHRNRNHFRGSDWGDFRRDDGGHGRFDRHRSHSNGRNEGIGHREHPSKQFSPGSTEGSRFCPTGTKKSRPGKR